jgi:signal transduction histidine kinase
MLHEFLDANRAEILSRTGEKVAARMAPRPTDEELKSGVPIFLDQLIQALRLPGLSNEAIGKSAAEHGGDLLRIGFTVAQVVYVYGDVCQAVTELAHAMKAPITVEEFNILNRCIDEAIAEAVAEFTRQREKLLADEGSERLAVLAHEMRNQLSAAMLAFEMLKRGSVGVGGSTGAMLGRSLAGLRDLIARSFADVRLESGLHRRGRVSVAQLVEEIEIEACMEANARGLELAVTRAAPGVDVEVDRQILAAAIANLLQNAFKFSRANGHVALKVHATEGRVLFEIEDECGGLPPGKIEELFVPFEQRSINRSGLGLGLSISRKGVEANGGLIRVLDLPGRGCVFTIDLPRMPPPKIA